MKKLLFAVAVGLLVVAAFAVTTARADNGPHGGFQANTDACAGCHRAHTAQGADFLLVQGDIYQLCTGCHNGAGAYTNVVDGIYQNAVLPLAAPLGQEGDKGIGLFGGGFVNAAMNTTRALANSYDTASTNPTPSAVTSHHSVDTATAGTVWGSGDISASANTGGTLTLECTSCHDPHGKAGRTGGLHTGSPVASYRLLRFQPSGSNGYEAVTGPSGAYFTKVGVTETGPLGGVFVADTVAKWYTINADVSIDSSVVAYRHRANTPWWAYINARGDYAGRSYIYQRPAFAVVAGTASGASTQVSCTPVATGAPLDTSCAYSGANGTFSNTAAMGNLGYWCATCHDRYLADGTGRSTDSGDALYKYRHATTSVACVNCHTAHGTTAAMTTALAQNATLNSVAGLTGYTNLLKLDNRGLCADCHGYDVGFSTDTLVTP